MKTPPELPDEPPAYQLQTGREKTKGALTAIGIFFFLAMFFASLSSIIVEDDEFTLANRPTERAYDSYERGSSDSYYYEALLVLGGYYFCLIMIFYSLYTYITTEISDEKPPEATMYEQEMEQYNLKLERYQEELKKESPFYIGDGSTGSEMKNTCKRCNKIWYLDAEELKDLESRLETSNKLMAQMGGLSMATALFNPMLAAQSTTTMAANTGALKSLADELNDKSRCPECNSKNIERTLVEKDEKVLDKKVKEVANKSEPSKIQELEKLAKMKKEGLIDDDEFKQMKKEILEK